MASAAARDAFRKGGVRQHKRKETMRTHWWHSIRWRLALGSMLVALLATALLALIVLVSVPYFYGLDQRTLVTNLASSDARRIGLDMQQHSDTLAAAASGVLAPLVRGSEGQDYLVIVYDYLPNARTKLQPVYPTLIRGRPTLASVLLASTDPTLKINYTRVRNALNAGLRGQQTVADIADSGPPATARPFVVQPIFYGGDSSSGPVVGVLFITPRYALEGTMPPLVATLTRSILVASVVVALIAALAAILFSRTITRPLAKLTSATRLLSAGNYGVRVETGARGELGELAHNFNEMAAQLQRDVEELRKQELWRRELIMNITHDLATPLTAIAGLGESLVDGVNRNREDYEATGRIIVRETLRLRRLVKDLHMMARMEAGALKLQRRPVRLAVLVDEVFAVLTPEFERANVEPCNTIDYNLPAVQADPDMLTRVFSNLCDNALRHTPAGGMVVVDAVQQGKTLLVAVTDTGSGIPTQALPRVFDRFYRADVARQGETGGSGLGLAIVRAIVEAHGGRIWAENVQGAGARILFTLPLL
jgi:signal transduction histidine kinase